MDIADTPQSPNYAVIFSSLRNEGGAQGHEDDGSEAISPLREIDQSQPGAQVTFCTILHPG